MPSAAAADAAKVGSCLLQNCQKEFAQCIGDANCLQNLACLNACALSDDESACQIRCGDRFEDKAVTVFNACAVSEKKCVPQRVDKGGWQGLVYICMFRLLCRCHDMYNYKKQKNLECQC